MLFDSMGSNGATTALDIDCPMPLDLPMFVNTQASHWESNVGSFALDPTHKGLLSETPTVCVCRFLGHFDLSPKNYGI